MSRSGKLTKVLLSFLLLAAGGSAGQAPSGEEAAWTASPETEVWGYDPAQGTAEDDIRQNFNLRRGRWWNYYERGSWYLAYDHYQAAERDFRLVIWKRPTDKRDARTYGMHFRDCFGHRELGIALYYQAIQTAAAEKDALSRLEESIRELQRSRAETPSARAEFFLALAQGKRWQARDVTPPVIAVENAASAGPNWAILFCTRRVAPLDIRVTDDQSGIGVVWLNERELVFDRSLSKIPTVYVPLDADDAWVQIRARDLVGNTSRTTQVRVHVDSEPPLVFATAYPEQASPGGLVPVTCSARDDLGLRTIQVADQRIDCEGRREYHAAVSVRFERGAPQAEMRVTDLAGNAVKGVMRGAPKTRRVEPEPERVGPLGRPVSLAGRSASRLWLPRTRPCFPSALGPSEALLPGRDNVYARRPFSYAALTTEVSEPAGACLPVFAFEDYRPDVFGGYPVAYDRYCVQGTLEYATGVEAITVDDKLIRVDPNSDVVMFSKFVPLPDYEVKKIHVQARCASGSPVQDTLTVKRVPDATIQRDSVYSVVVLPLRPEGTPSNPHAESLYPSITDAVAGCELSDPNVATLSIPRFDCTKTQGLDLGAELRALGVAGTSPEWQVLRLGEKHGVDLGIWGRIREYNENFEITVYVVDIGTRRRLPISPIDVHGPRDECEWYVSSLIQKLKTALPRVRAAVTGKSLRYTRRIYLDRGMEDNLFLGQKLCIFDMEEGPARAKLAEATVDALWSGRSEAKLAEKDDARNRLLDVKPDQLFVLTK